MKMLSHLQWTNGLIFISIEFSLTLDPLIASSLILFLFPSLQLAHHHSQGGLPQDTVFKHLWYFFLISKLLQKSMLWSSRSNLPRLPSTDLYVNFFFSGHHSEHQARYGHNQTFHYILPTRASCPIWLPPHFAVSVQDRPELHLHDLASQSSCAKSLKHWSSELNYPGFYSCFLTPLSICKNSTWGQINLLEYLFLEISV